jgi:cystathionine beta-lyase
MKYDFDLLISREHTSCYKYDLRGKYFGRKDVLPMWVADMDFATPPFVINALRNRLRHEVLGYSFFPDSYYSAIIDWLNRKHAWPVRKEWISFSPGVVPALNLLIMALTKPGDAVVVQPPVYFPFFSAVSNHGRILVNNPLVYSNGTYSMDFEKLSLLLSPNVSMFILCSPHNPTGNVWKKEDLFRLALLCKEKKIILLSDEIHCDLVYPGNRHIPLASLSPEIADITVTCMAPSKTFNLAGLSTSYLIISNPELKEKYDSMLDHVHVGAGNIFGTLALEAAYNQGDEWLDQLMDYLNGNLTFLIGFIAQHIPVIEVVKPESTYMVWLDCRKLGMGPARLRNFMIQEAGLGLSDGPLFGEEGEGFQRINIACPRSILEKALLRLRDAIHRNQVRAD